MLLYCLQCRSHKPLLLASWPFAGQIWWKGTRVFFRLCDEYMMQEHLKNEVDSIEKQNHEFSQKVFCSFRMGFWILDYLRLISQTSGWMVGWIISDPGHKCNKWNLWVQQKLRLLPTPTTAVSVFSFQGPHCTLMIANLYIIWCVIWRRICPCKNPVDRSTSKYLIKDNMILKYPSFICYLGPSTTL